MSNRNSTNVSNKQTIDDKAETVQHSEEENEPLQPRTRNDLLNLRRQLKGTLDYVETTLRKQGAKV